MSGFSLVRTNKDAYTWRCNSCLKEYTNAHEAEDCCSKLGMSTHSCNKPDYHHRVTQLESRVKVLEEIIQSTISEEGHGKYCDAIKGPEPETWLVEEDCNCWVKYARAALKVKPNVPDKEVSILCRKCCWLTAENLCGHWSDTYLDSNNTCGLFEMWEVKP